MMFSRKELRRIYGLAGCLLLVAVACYAALPAKPPQRPIRVAFQTAAGKVLFDHTRHLAEAGYGLACGECHHTLAPEEYDQAGSCSACHNPEEGDESMLKRSDALHRQCMDCHKEYGGGPIDCAQCHVMQ